MAAAIITVEALHRALGGEIRKGKQGRYVACPGPGHSAADRSMSVTPSQLNDEGFVVSSFAKDDWRKCKDYVRQRLQMPPFEPKAKPNGGQHSTARKDLGRVIAKYDYVSMTGELLFQVVRYEPKDFRQRRPNGQGGWIYNLKGVKLVPYRLDQIIEATATSPVIFVVEGEKDAGALWAIGIPATCNPMGAGKWKDEYSAYFIGATVFVVADNDPPGAAHADEVVASIRKAGGDAFLLRLPNLPPKGDVSDWLAAGGTAEKLYELAEGAVNLQGEQEAPPEQEAPKTETPAPEASDAAGNGTAPIETLVTMKASAATLRAIQWLWPGRFALGKIGLLVGLPDEGKGQILCDIAARVTRGAEWPRGEGKAPQGNVVLLTAEDDIDDTVATRLEAAGADRSKIEIIKMVMKAGAEDRMFSFVTDLALLRRKVAEVGNVKLILVDPLSAYLGVKTIDSFRTTDVRAVMGPLVTLANELKVAIIAVMHFNKKVDVTNALLRISDSMAFGATARHVWAAIDDSENQRKLLVKGKNNLAPANIKALSYGFGVGEVGKDPETGQTIMAPHIVWFGHVDVSATEAMQAASENRSPGAKDEARKFLIDILANGPVPTSEIEDAANGNGIAWRTVERAKRELGIIAKKDGPKDEWRWHSPRK
jgi:hypothetical protein